jgi:hypothetical protein
MSDSDGMLVRHAGELGMCGATILSAGTVTNNWGGTIGCTLTTNSYQCSYPGFKQKPLVFVTNHDANSCTCSVMSVTTSTCTIDPFTYLATGGTATNADFGILVVGLGAL